MRVLFVHNYYQQRGGEDGVFEQEVSLLRERGYVVETVEFTNEGFDGSLMGNLMGAVQSLYNSRSARRVERAIDAFNPDVVHIHNLFYTASPSVIRAAKRRGIPVVMTLHNYRLVCNNGVLSREAETPCERCLTKTIPLDGIRYGCFRHSRLESAQLTAITSLHKLTGLWRSVDRFIVLTDFAREKFLQSSLNLRPQQVVVKPNFIAELGYVEPTQRQDFFLYVGRLSFEKGIQALIQSAHLHSLPLEIIGDGPLRPMVEQAARDLANVRYNGPLPREQTLDRMKQCRAIVVPSIWYEGLPTVILEAFATGTPILCSDLGNLNTIVTNQKTGTLFKTSNAAAISAAMMSLTDELCIQYAQAGRSVFQQQYSKLTILKKIDVLYFTLSKSTKSTLNIS